MSSLTPAESLLQSLGVTEPHEIDLEAIAWSQGVVVNYRSLDGCEARIIGNADKAIITVSDSAHEKRKRFSIGHELGHWHHHRGQSFLCRTEDIGNFSKSGGNSGAEQQADRYSANLLLPNYIFRDVANQYSEPTLDTVFSIADAFNVSKTSTAIKFVESNFFPCILICYSQAGRKWFRRGKDVPDILFPVKELDHETQAFDVLYGDNSKTSRTISPGDCWFNWWQAERYEVWEESFKLNQDTILTLLTWKNEAMLEGAENA